MKRNTNKTLIIILLVIVANMLIGCGSGDNTVSNSVNWEETQQQIKNAEVALDNAIESVTGIDNLGGSGGRAVIETLQPMTDDVQDGLMGVSQMDHIVDAMD